MLGKDIHSSFSETVNMKLLIIVSALGFAASASFETYGLPDHGRSSFGHGGTFVDHGGSSGTTFGTTSDFSHGTSSSVSFDSGSSFGSGRGFDFGASCGDGQVRHTDGRCVTPRENRRVFVYDVPRNVRHGGGSVNIPEPRVETNVILIRTPEGGVGVEPIVVPPPQQRHVVYVLNKQSTQDQRVIEVPSSGPQTPEVYFVNYADGENPTLPSGVDLQTALQTASHGGGQQIGSVGHSGSVGGSSFSSGGFVESHSGSFGGLIGGSEFRTGDSLGQSFSADTTSFVNQPSVSYGY